MYVLLGDHATLNTASSWVYAATCFLVVKSHTCTTELKAPEARYLPSGDHATDVIVCSPCKVATYSPVSASQTCTPVRLGKARYPPSGDQATAPMTILVLLYPGSGSADILSLVTCGFTSQTWTMSLSLRAISVLTGDHTTAF